VVLIGLGHVGGALAARLAAAGARLTVTDVNPRARELAARLGAEWVSPEAALFVDCDVLAPCALGGTLNHDTVPLLRAPVIAGAANNQLSDDSVAASLAARGIRRAPDFVANAGGLIAVVDEHMTRGFDAARVERAIDAIGDTLAEVYRRASRDGVDTLAAAQALAAERRAALAAAPPPRTVAAAA
jgi:leucine dehydrogenase